MGKAKVFLRFYKREQREAQILEKAQTKSEEYVKQ